MKSLKIKPSLSAEAGMVRGAMVLARDIEYNQFDPQSFNLARRLFEYVASRALKRPVEVDVKFVEGECVASVLTCATCGKPKELYYEVQGRS